MAAIQIRVMHEITAFICSNLFKQLAGIDHQHSETGSLQAQSIWTLCQCWRNVLAQCLPYPKPIKGRGGEGVAAEPKPLPTSPATILVSSTITMPPRCCHQPQSQGHNGPVNGQWLPQQPSDTARRPTHQTATAHPLATAPPPRGTRAPSQHSSAKPRHLKEAPHEP